MDEKVLIRLEMEAAGLSATASEIESIYSRLRKMGLDAAKTPREWDKALKSSTRALQRQQSEVKRLNDSWKSTAKSVAGYATTVAGAIIGGKTLTEIIKKGYESVQKYNDAIRSLGVVTAKYGDGIDKVERNMERLSGSFGMLRKDIMGLAKDYERAFRVFTQGGMEQMIGNIRNVVGPNKQAIGEMMKSLTSLTDKIPELQTSMENLSKADRKRINNASELLVLSGEINHVQYKAIQDYLNGSKQATAEDKARFREIERQQKLVQELNAHWEKIFMLVGRHVAMPLMEEFVKLLQNNQESIESFFRAIPAKIDMIVEYFNKIPNTVKKWAFYLAAATVALNTIVPAAMMIVKPFVMVLGLVTSIISKIPAMATGMARAAASVPHVGGGLGRGAGGFLGRAGRGFGRIAKGGLFGAAAYGVGMAGRWGSEKLQDAGYTRTSGAVGAAGGLASAGGMAASGALIGSIAGPIGTAVGGAVGGIAGLISNWKSISEGVLRLVTGAEKTKSEEEEQERHNKAKNSVAKRLKEIEAERKVREAQEKASKLSEDKKNEIRRSAFDPRAVSADIQKRDELRKKFAPIEAKFEQKLESEGFTDKDREAKLKQKADATKKIETLKAERSKSSGDETKAWDDAIKKEQEKATLIEQEIESFDKRVEEIKKEVDGYQEISAELDKQNQKMTVYTSTLAQHKLVLEDINKLRQSEGAVLDSLVAKQAAVGQVNEKVLLGQYEKMAASAQMEKQQLDDMINLSKKLASQGGPQTEEDRQKLQEMSPTFERFGVTQEQIKAGTEINKLEEQRNKILPELFSKLNKISDAYDTQLALLSENTNMFSNMVDLADNFALGIGASAEMRLGAVKAIGQEIDTLEKKRQFQMKIAAGVGEEAIQAKTKVMQIENEILNKQKQQASMTKQLRDGWIDAISAMNTGAGRFTKIMISGEKSLGTGLSRFKTLATHRTGSLQGGYETSERYGAGGIGHIENAKKGAPYETYMNNETNQAAYMAGDIARGSANDAFNRARELGRSIQGRSEEGAAGSSLIISGGANPHVEASLAGGNGSYKLSASDLQKAEASMGTSSFSSAMNKAQSGDRASIDAILTASGAKDKNKKQDDLLILAQGRNSLLKDILDCVCGTIGWSKRADTTKAPEGSSSPTKTPEGSSSPTKVPGGSEKIEDEIASKPSGGVPGKPGPTTRKTSLFSKQGQNAWYDYNSLPSVGQAVANQAQADEDFAKAQAEQQRLLKLAREKEAEEKSRGPRTSTRQLEMGREAIVRSKAYHDDMASRKIHNPSDMISTFQNSLMPEEFGREFKTESQSKHEMKSLSLQGQIDYIDRQIARNKEPGSSDYYRMAKNQSKDLEEKGFARFKAREDTVGSKEKFVVDAFAQSVGAAADAIDFLSKKGKEYAKGIEDAKQRVKSDKIAKQMDEVSEKNGGQFFKEAGFVAKKTLQEGLREGLTIDEVVKREQDRRTKDQQKIQENIAAAGRGEMIGSSEKKEDYKKIQENIAAARSGDFTTGGDKKRKEVEAMLVRSGYAAGGKVPGQDGSPQLAIVHGGETISPPSSQGVASGGQSMNVNFGQLVINVRGVDLKNIDRVIAAKVAKKLEEDSEVGALSAFGAVSGNMESNRFVPPT